MTKHPIRLLQAGAVRASLVRGLMGLLLAMLCTASVRASLEGVQISGCTDSVYDGTVTADPGVCEPQAAGFDTTAIVGDGIEFSIDSSRQVDFTADTVSLIYNSSHGSSSPDLFVFSDLIWQGMPAQITGLELLTPDPLNVTTAFTDDAIGLLVGSPQASTAQVTVTFRILTIPEPTSFGLLTIGLVGWQLSRRRVC